MFISAQSQRLSNSCMYLVEDGAFVKVFEELVPAVTKVSKSILSDGLQESLP